MDQLVANAKTPADCDRIRDEAVQLAEKLKVLPVPLPAERPSSLVAAMAMTWERRARGTVAAQLPAPAAPAAADIAPFGSFLLGPVGEISPGTRKHIALQAKNAGHEHCGKPICYMKQ